MKVECPGCEGRIMMNDWLEYPKEGTSIVCPKCRLTWICRWQGDTPVWHSYISEGCFVVWQGDTSVWHSYISEGCFVIWDEEEL